MDEEVILSKEALKAIGSETRILILKALKERQKTQSEVASELKLSPPTILEHIEQLKKAKLVEIVPGYIEKKWKYYQLTKTGRTLIEGKRTSIVLLLSYVSAVLTVGLLFLYLALPSFFGSQPIEPGQTTSGNSCNAGLQIQCSLSNLSSSARSWIAILAMFFLIIGAALFVYHLLSKKKTL